MEDRDFELRRECARFLSHHRPAGARETLERLARHPLAERPPDYYGSGGAAAELERRVVALLGKDAGMFFAKGMIAQQCLLRVCSEQRASPYIALSPMSHIDFDEANGVEYLHRLRPIRLGRYAPFALKDLQAITERLAAVVIELPLRRAGYRLPPWDELERMSGWCRDKQVPLHFDGARLWEAAAGYGRQPGAVAALADSVYVSFYKGLGGLAGCVVAGTRETTASMQVWRTRHGGSLFTSYPYVLSALDGLDRQLARLPDYVARARRLAERIYRERICEINPSAPDVNAFQLILPGTIDALRTRHREFAAREKVWLSTASSSRRWRGGRSRRSSSARRPTTTATTRPATGCGAFRRCSDRCRARARHSFGLWNCEPTGISRWRRAAPLSRPRLARRGVGRSRRRDPMLTRIVNSSTAAILAAGLMLSACAARQGDAAAQAASDDGIVRVRSAYAVDETVARLKQDVADKGIMFFMEVDQAGLAADAGIDLRPSTLLIFGNPPLGTQFIAANANAGLDWPVRLLVAEDEAGDVWAVYTDFDYIKRRHRISDRDAQFAMAAEVIASITSSVAAK